MSMISKNTDPLTREVEVLYYIVQLLQALDFCKKKNFIYLALDHLK